MTKITETKTEKKQKWLLRIPLFLLFCVLIIWLISNYNRKSDSINDRNEHNQETINKIDHQQQLYDSLSAIIELQRKELQDHEHLLDSFRTISKQFHNEIYNLRIESKNIGEAAKLLKENIKKEKQHYEE